MTPDLLWWLALLIQLLAVPGTLLPVLPGLTLLPLGAAVWCLAVGWSAGWPPLLLALVLNLSLKLRAAEMQTMFRLGCSRLTILRLQSAEVLLLLTSAAGIAVAGGLLARSTAAALLQQLLL